MLKQLYNRAPISLQELLLNAYALKVHRQRYGRRFESVSRLLEASERFTTEAVARYQNAAVERLIRHAYDTVPYYRSLFERERLNPEDVRTTEDLRHVPLLTREVVRAERDRLVSRAVRRSALVPGHTSGTTGSPLGFFWDLNTCVYTNGVDWRQKRWAGVRYGEPIALLLGRMIVPVAQRRPPFWRLDRLHNQLWMSSFHLSPEHLPWYVEKLEGFRPAAIEGYPSTLYLLARYLRAARRSLRVKAAFTSSETLLPVQRETIEEALECKVFDFYGLAERVLFATECEAHSGRHLNFEFGFTECVDSKGDHVRAGQLGIVVGTSLQNFGMPFIRYRTNDVSSIRPMPCPCGRAMPLLEDVTTKAEDIVVAPDGRLISPSILTHPFKPLDNIEASQIEQTDRDRLVVRVVRRPAYTEADTRRLVSGLRERVGDAMRIEVEFVDDVLRTASGKFRWVISKVPVEL